MSSSASSRTAVRLGIALVILTGLVTGCAPAGDETDDVIPGPPDPVGPRAMLTQEQADAALPTATGSLTGWAEAPTSRRALRIAWNPKACAPSTDGSLRGDELFEAPVLGARSTLEEEGLAGVRITTVVLSFAEEVDADVLDPAIELRADTCAKFTEQHGVSQPLLAHTIAPLPMAELGDAVMAHTMIRGDGGTSTQSAVVVLGHNIVKVAVIRPGEPDDAAFIEQLEATLTRLTEATLAPSDG